MAIKFDVIAKTGTYTDKNGQEKNRWLKCGVVMETAKGLSMKLESMPISSDGWFVLSEPKPKDERQPSLGNLESDPPF
jgi:hypothetical protein